MPKQFPALVERETAVPGDLSAQGTVLKGFNWKFCEEKGLKYQATPGFEP
jgi:hypothetical protein